ncbi:hypothetical protein LCGC14_2357120 [marine sediment metagenome]|uniref:Uncharacterized protein n=1 Tax=marine sediment metagenome TaxID=412755 RepID=A0A0F9C7E9_9ZZZZ
MPGTKHGLYDTGDRNPVPKGGKSGTVAPPPTGTDVAPGKSGGGGGRGPSDHKTKGKHGLPGQ